MKNKHKLIHKYPQLVFSIVALLFILLYWFIMVITRGNWLNTYYLNDYNDTYMDYYNMLANLYDAKHPYRFNANYPALCFLIWRVLFHIVPFIPESANSFFLRTYTPATLGYILCNVFLLIYIYELLSHMISGKKITRLLLSVSIIFSGPFIFALERGNIILLSFAFTLSFCVLYNSDKKTYRILGYLCLSIAAAVKIYPALFGLLVIHKKRVRESILAVFIGIIVFLIPFFSFEGIKSFKDFLHGILYANSLQGDIGMGYNFSLKNLTKIFSVILGHNFTTYYPFLLIIMVCLCLALSLLSTKEWQRSLGIILMIIWIPDFSYTYVLIFLFIPLIQFLNELQGTEISIKNLLIGFCFLLIQIPLALPTLAQYDIFNAKFPLTYPTLIINFAIVCLAIITYIDTLVYTLKKFCNFITSKRHAEYCSSHQKDMLHG